MGKITIMESQKTDFFSHICAKLYPVESDIEDHIKTFGIFLLVNNRCRFLMKSLESTN